MSVKHLVTLGMFAAVAGSAQAQWSVTVLETGSSLGFPSVNAVLGNRQGGAFDDGLQAPVIWAGQPNTATYLPLPPGADGGQVTGLSASGIVGDGFIYNEPGYYGVFLWTADGSSVSVIEPPSGFEGAFSAGIAGDHQVGHIEDFDIGRSIPSLWRGTSASRVNLLPAGYDGGRALGTDGTRQVGQVWSDAGAYEAALWTGTAASFVSLHPGGPWLETAATSISGSRQCGYAYDGESGRAVVWQGTAASMIDLHPSHVPDLLYSQAEGISGDIVCGSISLVGTEGSLDRAAVWTGLSAGSFVDLHSFLGPDYYDSRARAVWTDGNGLIHVVGVAQSALDFYTSAVMWTLDPCNLALTVPATAQALTGDLDGDMVLDSCTPPTDDCNNNGLLDSNETLEFINETFLSGPGVWSVNGAASVESGVVTLTPPAMGQGGAIARAPLTSGPTERLRAIFDFRMTDNSGPGDGFSFSLIDADVFTTSVNFGEDGIDAPGVITLKFNTWQNYPQEGFNSVGVRYGGGDIAYNTTLPFLLADESWHRAVVDLTPDGRVSVRLGTQAGDMVTVHDQVQLPGYTPKRSVVAFGARTGSAFSRHMIANVRLGVNGANDQDGNGEPDSCGCRADFNLDGFLDFFDYDSFVECYETEVCGGNTADYNGDGFVDFFDYDDFVLAFETGC